MAVKTCVWIIVISVVTVAVSASLVEHFIKVPLFEVGGLLLTATHDLLSVVKKVLTNFTDLSSTWSYLGIAATTFFLYKAYLFIFAPMNRVRLLHEVGYCDENYHKQSNKDVCNMVKKQRRIGDCPPCFPNGWFSVIDSHDLKVGAVKNVSCLGELLAMNVRFLSVCLSLDKNSYLEKYYSYESETLP